MKKALSLILALVLVLSCLAGCAGGAATGDESDPLAARGIGESAEGLPSGIMMTKAVAEIVPQIIADIDAYLDGDMDEAAAIEKLNAYRSNYDFSMAHTHDIEVKKHLDKVIKFLKDIVKEAEKAAEETEEVVEETEEVAEGEEVVEEEEEPSLQEQILERRNAIAAILELDLRDAI